MKKILFIVALAGFTAASSYAQNTKDCSCKHKTVHHTTAHHIAKAAKTGTADKDRTIDAVLYAVPSEQIPCYAYRKDNIVVMECPDMFYDQAGNAVYIKDNVYLGNYPVGVPPKATQQSVNKDYGERPSSDNLCFWNCR